MKRLLFFLLLCISVTGCIDDAYDLSKLDTGENSGIVIGNDKSEFKMPLAIINFSMASFNQSGGNGYTSITDLIDEVNIWLPSTLPGGVDYIEIGRLMSDSDYLNSILTALVDEMNADEQKRNEVCLLVAEEYRSKILSLLDGVIPTFLLSAVYDLSNEEAGAAIAKLYVTFNDIVAEAIKSVSADFLMGLQMDKVSFQIPSLDVSSEVYDMLAANLDPDYESNPVNALYIYGTIESQLPISFVLYPSLEGLRAQFGEIAVSEGVNSLNDVRLTADDLYTLTQGYGSRFITSIYLNRYYVNKKISKDQKVSINLKLRKTGGLKL